MMSSAKEGAAVKRLLILRQPMLLNFEIKLPLQHQVSETGRLNQILIEFELVKLM